MPSFRFNLLIVISFFFYLSTTAQEKTSSEKNKHCLKCHTNQTYTFYNDWTERDEKRLMNPLYILDSVKFATGAHKDFVCTDCHTADYEKYPHDAELKLEPLNTCLDCHGGDETYASYQFEKVDEEFLKSIHSTTSGESFTCSKCHNQHYYKATARTSENIDDIVIYSNEMCLSCHNNMKRYQLVSEHDNPQLIRVHDWLPNQELHFQHVRCIECHTEVVDSLMVSHNILSKDKAVQKCVECHTSDSRLKASLYKYQNLLARTEDGNINAILSNKSYVIGAYQNPILNLLSFIIFIVTIAGIAIHSVFRIIKKTQ